MKKVLLVLLLLCSGLLFAEEKKIEVGDWPYYFAVKNFGFSNSHKHYEENERQVLEIAPYENVCKISLMGGFVFYVRKGEKVRFESTGNFFAVTQYEGVIKDYDYNYIILDVHEVTEYSKF